VSPIAIGFLMLAAVLHAGWNILARQAADRQATLWWGLVVAGTLLVPTVLGAWPPPWEAVALAAGSSIFEALYFVTLLAAYGLGDFSLVYPVARGSAPLLTALWAVLLLGERPSTAGWLGIGLVVVGIVLVSAPDRAQPARPSHRPGLALILALITGACISGYSVINKVGLQYISPPAFTSLFHVGTALLLLPYLARSRRRKLLAPWRQEERWRTAGVSVMLAGASTLVLTALSIEPASYVGAGREISVVLGALAGWLLLGEPLGLRRTFAAAVMFSGLALIALRG
jgi:drug/metabolite transporter (DMT)-like permease